MKTVKKVWGFEQWIVNRECCGKILNLKKGFESSLHKHRKKDETFFVLDGIVLMELGKKKWVMNPGDSVHVPPNKYHGFSGLKNSRIIEFSTKHLESDSYRKTQSGKFDLQEAKKQWIQAK